MLNLYRRHRSKCGVHPHNSFSYESDENRRNWRNCACPIFASGALGGKFKRQNTDEVEWADAKSKAAQWERAGTWDAADPTIRSNDIKPVEPRTVEIPESPSGHPLEDSIAQFIAFHDRHSAKNTRKKYKYLTALLQKFGDDGPTDPRLLTPRYTHAHERQWTRCRPRAIRQGI